MKIVNNSEHPVTDIDLEYQTNSKSFNSHASPLVAANKSRVVISFEDSAEIDALVSMLSEFKKYVERAYSFVPENSRIDRRNNKG